MPSRNILIICSVLLLGGCAYAFESQLQDVRIETPGAYNARCIVDVDGFRYKFNPPETVNIKKSKEDMLIDCRAPGNRTRTMTISPRDSEVSNYNFAHGYVLGGAVDYISGAAFQYPDIILVDFTGMENIPEDLPAHNAPDVIQPEEYDLEEFLPSQPRLNSDRYAVPNEIQKRERQPQNFYETNAFGRMLQPLQVTPDADALNPAEEGAGETGEATTEDQQELINMADPSGEQSAPEEATQAADPVQTSIDPMALDPAAPPPETGAITTVPSTNEESAPEEQGPEAPVPQPEAAPPAPSQPETQIPVPVPPPPAPGTEAAPPAEPQGPTQPAPFPPPDFLEKSNRQSGSAPATNAPTAIPRPVAPAQTNL
jgi:hypothetical protein